TPEMMEFMRACVEARLNMFISGGTGSGKTTLLNILSGFIPEDERIITIEDAAELKLVQDHVVRLESRAANIEGKGQVSIMDLVKNSLRMRPERIVVGETRGGEALSMLQAMNTGHDGSLSTGHANSPRDILARLETMCLMAGVELPARAIREQIASALDLIIQISRLKDGSRKITNITEVQGMEGETIVLQDVFVFEQTGYVEGKVQGRLRPTGIRPKFSEKFEAAGIQLPRAARPCACRPSSASRGVLLHPARRGARSCCDPPAPAGPALRSSRSAPRVFPAAHVGRAAHRQPPQRLQQAAPRHDHAALE